MVVIGVVSTLAGSGLYSYADGVGSAAHFRSPGGVAVSSSGVVFVVDSLNNRIRMITTSGIRAIENYLCRDKQLLLTMI